ncbi:hypothetical protein HZB78_02055 [Candidatus Collierbacteria bacterium]|nr:hypothetical protein [Candidatus Collierbacteria bacterium]
MSTLIQMSKKRTLTIVVIAALGITIVMLILNKAFQKRPSFQKPPVHKPIIESNYSKGSLNIEALLKKSDINIPASLPVYSLGQSNLSLEESVKIAFFFGFSDDPQSLNDVRFGPVYIWSDTKIGNLRIVANLRIIDYKRAQSQPETRKGPFKSEQEIVSKAKRFLVGTGLITEEISSSSQVRYLNMVEEGLIEAEKENAGVAEIRFKEILSQYPVVNATPDVGTINVTLNRENSVVSAYIDQTNILEIEGERQLKTFSTLLISLKDAKVLSLDNGNIDLSSLGENEINKIVVEGASIGYYQEFSQNQLFLQPIFILTGHAQFRNGKNVSALLYLPALADSAQ